MGCLAGEGSIASIPMALPTGTRLGPYEILGQIGSGGMGEVYRARDPRLGREVAIKVLPAPVSSDPDRLKRFEKEARSASALNHPGIVTIHDIGQSGGPPTSRWSWWTARRCGAAGRRRVADEEAAPIAAQVADGLAKAHGAGIAPGPKPENVMVTRDGFVKILDFGLAKLTQPEDPSGATAAPTVRAGPSGHRDGDCRYMSPEQALGKALDFRSDQFSFGSILYELATGVRAFQRGARPRPSRRSSAKSPPRSRAPHRRHRLRCVGSSSVVSSKSPDDRYASSRDLARDLSDLRERLPEASGATSSATTPLRVRTPKWLRTALGLTTFAALAAAILLRPGRDRAPVVGPTRFLVDTSSSASFISRPPVTGLAVSPDGRRIAFIAGSGSRFRLWVRSLDEVEPRPLPGTEWAASPFWSPDGRQIAFSPEASSRGSPWPEGRRR
jgi:serine/threonine protein kinase